MTKFKYFILIFLIPIVIFTGTVNAGIEVRGEKATGAATWNAANFPAFWYDIDTDKSTETLTILGSISNSNRLIETGNLQYDTFVTSTPFELYKNIGLTIDGKSNYNIIGWQAEKWNGIKGTTNKIVKIAFEMGKEDKKTLTVGETWSLGAGYELTINAIDARANPRQVWFTLKKDGAIIDEGIGQAPLSADQAAKQKAVYYKTKTILGESNTLLFTVYVDTIFSGATSDMVQFKYAWLIDESSAREIKVGDIYGVFGVKTADWNNVKLSNKKIVSLARNTETTIMGNMKFKVADTDTLRLYPFVPYIEPGKYEVRGKVFSTSTQNSAPSWNAQTFPGLWYDLDSDQGAETLSLSGSMNNANRFIEANSLIYRTSTVPVNYLVTKTEGVMVGGSNYYNAVGWAGEKYVKIKGVGFKFAAIALEMGKNEKKILTTGETWSLGAGYELTINAIDARTAPRQVWFTLKKDGAVIDEGMGQAPKDTTLTEKQKAVYTKTKTILGESDVPFFTVYVDNIFSGATSDMVQFKYAWLIDQDSAKQIKVGDKFGVFDVTGSNDNTVVLANKNRIQLSSGLVDLMGGIKFRVANDPSSLRFSPITDFAPFDGVAEPSYSSSTSSTNAPAYPAPRSSSNDSANAGSAFTILIFLIIILGYSFKYFSGKTKPIEVDKPKEKKPLKPDAKTPVIIMPPPKKIETLYTLIVEVKSGYNKTPIQKAIIMLEQQYGVAIERTSDIDGKAIFGKVKEGTYKLRTVSKGYEDHNQELKINQNNRLVIELKGTATLNISVFDALNERPLVGAEIRLGDKIYNTDDKGNAIISDIAFGSHILSILVDSYKAEELPLDVNEIIYYKKIYLQPEIKPDEKFVEIGNNLKISLNESMKKLSSACDICIPEYYLSNCKEIIRLIETISTTPFYADPDSKEKIFTLYFIADKIFKETEKILTNEDNISDYINMGYKGYKNTASVAINYSEYNQNIHLYMTDPKQFIEQNKKDVFNKLQRVDQEITQNLQICNVTSIANLWNISQKIIRTDTKDETREAASLLLGSILLDKMKEMFKNEEIIKRIRK